MLHRHRILAAVLPCLMSSWPVMALPPEDAIEARLRKLAGERPEAARLLDEMTAAREAHTFSREEFRKNVRVRMTDYQLAPDGTFVVSGPGCVVSGTPDSVLGSSLECVDRSSGKTEEVTYEAKIKFSDKLGLSVELSVVYSNQPIKHTEYTFENFCPVAVVIREMPDKSKYVIQMSPVLESKQLVKDYSENLTICLKDALLLVNGKLAGSFTCSGGFVGITSSKAKLKLEFALKAFKDAKGIGKTDGYTVWFEIDGKKYELHNSRPIIAGEQDSLWRVYVRSEPFHEEGDGSYSGDFGSLLLQDLLKHREQHEEKKAD